MAGHRSVKARELFEATPNPGHTAEVASVQDLTVAAGDHDVPIPVTDLDPNTASMRANAYGFLLTRDTMASFYDQYIDEARRGDAYAALLRAASMAGLAPALVIVAGHDPLHDEGVA